MNDENKCDEPLIVRKVIKARCTKETNHKGVHKKILMDGTELEWTNKKIQKAKAILNEATENLLF